MWIKILILAAVAVAGGIGLWLYFRQERKEAAADQDRAELVVSLSDDEIAKRIRDLAEKLRKQREGK